MAFSPLTPAVISKLPLGLLGFFGIKNGGQYPQSLGNAILPTLEQLDILGCNYHENSVASLTTVATGFQVSATPLTVPASELWYVQSVTLQLFTGVGDSITAALVVRSTQTGTASNFHRAIGSPVTQAASLFTYTPGTFDNGTKWFYPGDQFGTWVSAFVNASANASSAIAMEFSRFPF